MATLSGADADALDAAANELHKAAERLRSGRARVERPLHAAPWNGRGADAFRHEWSTNRRAEIMAAASFLDGAVQTLRRNADEQRRASGVGAGSGSAGAEGAQSRSLMSAVDGNKLLNSFFDLLDIFKALPDPVLVGIGIGSGLWDLFMDRNGYGGTYHGVESLMDVLGIVAGGAVLAGKVALGAGVVVIAGVATVKVIGVAMLAVAAVKGVDMLLGTRYGKAFMRGTAQVGRAAWRAYVGYNRAVFNGARSIAERGYSAVRDSAVGAANQAVSTTRRVVGAVGETAGRAVDAGARLFTSPFRTGMRLLGG